MNLEKNKVADLLARRGSQLPDDLLVEDWTILPDFVKGIAMKDKNQALSFWDNYSNSNINVISSTDATDMAPKLPTSASTISVTPVVPL